MEPAMFIAELTVVEVLTRCPQTIQVFFRYRLACVGCAMAPFHTLADVAANYGLRLDRFLDELQQATQFRMTEEVEDAESKDRHYGPP